MWVYQFRANLESGPSETPTSENSSPDSSEGLSYPPDSAREPSSGKAKDREANSRWSRRKRGFKLRLEGLSSKPKRITLAQSGQTVDSYASPPSREDILAMYEKMMESRMESCQRINKLIHSANRANLHNR
ncbi:hypothetical protein NMY22_g20277 [Coprinellus aureogranulatus]|nr:hypothetical protein NMY22_g20277 [Coprinellus aureogranulatus]